jgi:DNA/RNA endonuclease YhcR with UshA esterase domain
MSAKDTTGDCPSCGRYVGPYGACPHCGAALEGRVSVRRLKAAALVLSLGGLALLWLLATRSDVHMIQVAQVDAMMNMAYVRLQGRVVRPPTYDAEGGYVSFWLRDETGELRVSAYRAETRALVERGRVPELGDWVQVQGTLRVREDQATLTLNAPNSLEIRREEPLERAMGEIAPSDEFVRLRVRGLLRAIRSPYPGLTLLTLRDESGEIELAVTEIVTALDGGLPALAVGQALEVAAPVSLYKDTPQLSLARAADLVLLSESLSIAPQLSIAQVDGALVERWVSLSGSVTEVAPFSAGVKYMLDDGSGQITLLLWQSIYEQLADPGALDVGASLRVLGAVAEYRGEMEIVPELPDDVLVLSAPPQEGGSTPSPVATAVTPSQATLAPPLSPPQEEGGTPAPPQRLADLDAGQVGATLMVRGVVRSAESFAQGFKFALDDGSGQIVLLTWLDVYDGIAGREGLRVGASLVATGTLDSFEGVLQVAPAIGADVLVSMAGQGPDAPWREIGDLAGGDLVTIEGLVTRAEAFSGGMRVYVDDGSGEVMVLLWQNVLERVADGAGVRSVGARLRVVGRVEEYQGTLEVVPALPFDVEVVP